MNAVES